MLHETTHLSEEIKALDVSSDAFEYGGYIPSKYAFEKENKNPPLTLKKIPENAKSLVLILDSPEPSGQKSLQWLAWNIPPI